MGGRKHRFTKAEIDEAIINALSSQRREGGGWASAAFGALGKAGKAAVETAAQKVAREIAEAAAKNAAEAVARAAPAAAQAASKATAKAAAEATATAAAKNAAEAAAATGSKGLAGRVNNLVTKIAANPYIQVASIGASVAMPVYDELKSQEKARQVEAERKAAAAEYEKSKAEILAKNAADKLINDAKVAENAKKNEDMLKKANAAYDAQIAYYASAAAALDTAQKAEAERIRRENEQLLTLISGATSGTTSGATNPPVAGFTPEEIQAAIDAALAGNAAVGNPTVSPPPNRVGGPPAGNVVTSPPVVVVPPPITKGPRKKGGSSAIRVDYSDKTKTRAELDALQQYYYDAAAQAHRDLNARNPLRTELSKEEYTNLQRQQEKDAAAAAAAAAAQQINLRTPFQGELISCWPTYYPQVADPPKITDLAPPMQESLQQQIQKSMQLNNQLLTKRRNVGGPAIKPIVIPIRPPPKNPIKPPVKKGFTEAELNKAILAAIKNQRMF